MAVELLRIDDRLVHGQVVEGWVKALRINAIVVASDAVDADDTQKALYFLAVPHGVELSCLKLSDAASQWKRGEWKNNRARANRMWPVSRARGMGQGLVVLWGKVGAEALHHAGPN